VVVVTELIDLVGQPPGYNLNADPSFEKAVNDWTEDAGGSGASWTFEKDGTYARSGIGYASRVGSAATARRLYNNNIIECLEGDKFFGATFNMNGLVSCGVKFMDKDGATVSHVDATNIAGAVPGVLYDVFTVPDGASLAQFYVSGATVTGRADDTYFAQLPPHLPWLTDDTPEAQNLTSSTRANVAFGDLADTANSPQRIFTAPLNGMVKVVVGALMKSSAGGSRVTMAYEIVEDATPTNVFRAPTNADGVTTEATNGSTLERSKVITGLFPGRKYRARAKYKTAAAGTTGTFEDRRIIVQPATNTDDA
jgi:hypothetical protein